MKTVIFDFDGTLADTFVTTVRIFEKLTKRQQPFNDEEILRLRGMTMISLLRELRIRPWRVPWLLARGRTHMRKEMQTVVVFEGVEDVLKRLQADGVPIYIMSSNSPGNIRELLRRVGLENYFTHIYGNVGIFGKTKMLRLIIARNKLTSRDTFYVGDEGRDVEAAKRVGLKSVSVTWGYNSRELLASHHPHALADTRQELSDILSR